MLDAIVILGKGMFALIFKVTYNCMIHELRSEERRVGKECRL